MKREQIKALIELASSYEEADDIIVNYTGYKDYEFKTAYLQGMFNCEIIGSSIDSPEADYKALLTTIINKKWEN